MFPRSTDFRWLRLPNPQEKTGIISKPFQICIQHRLTLRRRDKLIKNNMALKGVQKFPYSLFIWTWTLAHFNSNNHIKGKNRETNIYKHAVPHKTYTYFEKAYPSIWFIVNEILIKFKSPFSSSHWSAIIPICLWFCF